MSVTKNFARISAMAALAALFALSGCSKSQDVASAGSSPSPAATVANVPAQTSAPPFAGTHYPSQGHRHFDEGESTNFKYNSDPPTSGPHKEMFSDAFNSPTPLPKYVQVHLLEHGNVLLQYNCKCPDIAGALYQIAYRYDGQLIPLDQLQPLPQNVQAAEEAGQAVIVAPYPGMSHKIALTAWTRLGTLDVIDQQKITSFINAYLHNQANASQ
jgi:Protein of unknown function (DUF3105)